MNMTFDRKGSSNVAIIESDGIVIGSVQDALDLMATASYDGDSNKLLIRKENIAEDFFELRTKLAGDILQKFTNYRVKLAIVGDFSGYDSKSLRNFIYECNQGKQFFFMAEEASALAALHEAG
ncbi:DUF4180 domain-containing protein [Paenibacillus sacheonensis]|uniref:DUF4180 domain-containing protein n=1 Tax=Paenibacillus sacheonensis TaxID=742054 RepID=A0A7X5C269_9BACL|nr:DUF4180 domain-containing protein [Paenibacillus sacheonensis]MBM7566631.1 hypothetical protein [Paenibacillus sacheonensis]NBC73547.1 DUF4180 domain-containing protein [Paenibacillus sacheonensis]